MNCHEMNCPGPCGKCIEIRQYLVKTLSKVNEDRTMDIALNDYLKGYTKSKLSREWRTDKIGSYRPYRWRGVVNLFLKRDSILPIR